MRVSLSTQAAQRGPPQRLRQQPATAAASANWTRLAKVRRSTLTACLWLSCRISLSDICRDAPAEYSTNMVAGFSLSKGVYAPRVLVAVLPRQLVRQLQGRAGEYTTTMPGHASTPSHKVR